MQIQVIRRFKLTTALIVGLLLPLSAVASPDEEITIRVMGINENSGDSVMKMIRLPELGQQQKQGSLDKPGPDAAGSATHREGPPGIQDNDRAMEQTRESELANERETYMEQLQENQQQQQEFESEHEDHAPGSEQSGGNQNGPGPGG